MKAEEILLNTQKFFSNLDYILADHTIATKENITDPEVVMEALQKVSTNIDIMARRECAEFLTAVPDTSIHYKQVVDVLCHYITDRKNDQSGIFNVVSSLTEKMVDFEGVYIAFLQIVSRGDITGRTARATYKHALHSLSEYCSEKQMKSVKELFTTIESSQSSKNFENITAKKGLEILNRRQNIY